MNIALRIETMIPTIPSLRFITIAVIENANPARTDAANIMRGMTSMIIANITYNIKMTIIDDTGTIANT